MDFATWEPIYTAILDDLGFDRAADERASALAHRAVPRFALDRVDLTGRSVGVVVGAALDAGELRRARAFDQLVATGDALEPLEAAALPVRLVVTDLDSDPPRVCARTHRGGIVAVHAHGDNVEALSRWLDRMDRRQVLATTQAAPTDGVVNFGGFTDGDRAAYVADGLGAASIDLVGWSLDDPTVDPMKRRKLSWAVRLLARLEDARAERYAALDGLRPSDG